MGAEAAPLIQIDRKRELLVRDGGLVAHGSRESCLRHDVPLGKRQAPSPTGRDTRLGCVNSIPLGLMAFKDSMTALGCGDGCTGAHEMVRIVE